MQILYLCWQAGLDIGYKPKHLLKFKHGYSVSRSVDHCMNYCVLTGFSYQ